MPPAQRSVDFADDWHARERFSNLLPARDKSRRGAFDERCKMYGKRRFPRNKRVEIAPRRAHLVEDRSDPEIELRETLSRIRLLLLFERMRDIFDFAGVGRQFIEESVPFTQVIWRASSSPRSGPTHAPISLFNCLTVTNCVRSLIVSNRFASSRNSVSVSVKPCSRHASNSFCSGSSIAACLTAIKWAARLPLSTVEYVLGRQRLERQRVVPIEEMSLKFFQTPERRKGQFETFSGFKQTEITEIARGEGRDQQQTDVRRRRAVGENRTRVFLKIIRRQPVVGIADEDLEETPGAPRN